MKLIYSIAICICFTFQCSAILAQSPGTVVDSGSLYSSRGGLAVSYSTTYLGSESCGRKFRITISLNNGESFKVNVAGSRVDLDDDYDAWGSGYSDCHKGAELMFGYYPGYEGWKIFDPGASKSNSHIIYMKSQTQNPKVSANIVARPA